MSVRKKKERRKGIPGISKRTFTIICDQFPFPFSRGLGKRGEEAFFSFPSPLGRLKKEEGGRRRCVAAR